MINIDKVSKSYGKDQVLDEVGLSIDKGKFTAFIGPNIKKLIRQLLI